MKKIFNKKLVLNKKTIAQLNNDEMNRVVGGNEAGCWKSHVLCGNTGLRTTCKSQSCTGDAQGVCILCHTL